MTKGQQFAKDMRHFLAIGTRTQRVRKGLDLHMEIADWARVAAMEPGTLHPEQQETFHVAFDAACSWYKHIKAGRASNLVLEHINGLSPYQFCNLLGEMIDAGVQTTSQGGQYFDQMRAELCPAAPVAEADAPGKTVAARKPAGGMSIRLIKMVRRLIAAARHIDRPLRYVALSGSHWDAVATGRLIRVRDFLARVGGDDLPDGKQAWFGRHAKKAYIAATGKAPLMVWTQHRTTGRFIHVCVYEPLELALYEALRTYKGTKHLLVGDYARCA